MKKLILLLMCLPFIIFTESKCGEGMIGLLETPENTIVNPVDPPLIIDPGIYNLDTLDFIGDGKAFTGNPDVISYYDYFNNTGHPDDVTMVLDEMNIMVYKNGEDYYLIFQISTDVGSHSGTRNVSILMETYDNDQNDSVIFSDDVGEVILVGNSNGKNNYVAIWSYSLDGDGAVIGPFKFGAKTKIIFDVYSALNDIAFVNKSITPYHLLNGGVVTNILIEFL